MELSGGERIRALLCGAFTADADYLLLDEPTNHLDRQGREWFYDQLARYQGACWWPPTTVNCWRRYRVFLN